MRAALRVLGLRQFVQASTFGNQIFYVVWSHGLTLNPNLLQGQQTVRGKTLVVKLAWAVLTRPSALAGGTN